MTSLSELVPGQRMMRLDDGQKGVVALRGSELRVVYVDRGEERLAQKSEKWARDEIEQGSLLPAERFLIAATCDRALRAYERNEPHKYWEIIPPTYVPYDSVLMQVIDAYLSQRRLR